MGTPRRRARDIRRWILESLRPKELDGRAVSQADCSLPSKDLANARFIVRCVGDQIIKPGSVYGVRPRLLKVVLGDSGGARELIPL